MKHLHFDTIDSTQDYLISTHRASQDVDLVSAKFQESGRGRSLNKWDSYSNSLAFSFKISPSKILTLTPLEMCILLLEYFGNDELFLKWPNDILKSNKSKCAGILVQLIDQLAFIGIGINYGISESSKNYRTSKSEIYAKKMLDSEYKSIPESIYQFIIQNRILDNEDLIKRWNSKCIHLNKSVSIIDGDISDSGIFKGIGPHGEALLQIGSTIKKIYNGSLILN